MSSPLETDPNAVCCPESDHPSRVGNYVILEFLGKGSYGRVFRAQHFHLDDRIFALKLLHRDLSTNQRFVRQFINEARLAGRLRHDCIAEVYDVGEVIIPTSNDPVFYIASRYVRGRALDVVLRDKEGIDLLDAVRLIRRLAGVLHYAHEHQIVHRDVKPGNILVCADRTPYLTDFGLAHRLGSEDGRAPQDAPVGTPAYMAPEQAEPGTAVVGPAADQYGLATILYEMTCGRHPIGRGRAIDELTIPECLRRIVNDPIPRPGEVVSSYPTDLEGVLLRALEKEPGHRYPSCGDFAAALNRWLSDRLEEANAFVRESDAAFGRGEYAAAIDGYSRALALNPRHTRAFANRSCTHYRLGALDRALRDCDRAIALEPRLVDPYLNRAQIHLGRGAPGLAIEDLSRAIERNPRSAAAYHRRGAARLQQGETDEAIDDLTRALSIEPSGGEYLQSRCLALLCAGRFLPAIDDYNAFLKVACEPAATELAEAILAAYHAAGEAHVKQRQYRAAISVLSEAITTIMSHRLGFGRRQYVILAGLHRARGRASMFDRHDADALNDFARAIELHPNDPTTFLQRARAYARRGSLGPAIADCRSAARTPGFLKWIGDLLRPSRTHVRSSG